MSKTIEVLIFFSLVVSLVHGLLPPDDEAALLHPQYHRLQAPGKRGFDAMRGLTFGKEKKNFDEIDRAGFGKFVKRNFDEIDRAGFAKFVKRNFDEIDRAGFGKFVKRNFDEIDRAGFGKFVKR